MLKRTILLLLVFSFSQRLSAQEKAQINWVSFEEAVELQKKEARKILVYLFYTECPNCGEQVKGMDGEITADGKSIGKVGFKVGGACAWCTRLEKKIWSDEEVIRSLNEHFYAVRLDASYEEPITYQGHVFESMKLENPKGPMTRIHELSLALTTKKGSYPNTIILTENMQRIGEVPGLPALQYMRNMLEFAHEEKYKEMVFADFEKQKRQEQK